LENLLKEELRKTDGGSFKLKRFVGLEHEKNSKLISQIFTCSKEKAEAALKHCN
jgi:hypothetical protein